MTKKKLQAGRRVVDRPSQIRSVSTGVPGFDAVLGGGLPEFSFNLIAGNPGTGKTTLAQQIVFANATRERPALYFTVLGEPTLKMLRYQQEFSFFDSALVGSAIQYLNLSAEALEQDLTVVLDRIVAEVERAKPSLVVVDSFRTFGGRTRDAVPAGFMTIDSFIQRLGLFLTTWEVTSFLIGEYSEEEMRDPVFTVADGVFWLSQPADRNSVVRRLQVMKVRGRAPMPGLHTYRITVDGLQIFPRIPEQQSERRPQSTRRVTTGVPGLDEMMGGGIPVGDAVMLAGPAGSGKTTFATQFVAEGLRQGESVVIVVFEEYPEEYLARAKARNQDLEAMLLAGKLKLIYLRPLDLSVDETLAEILESVHKLGATRVVIDSLSGFEVALAPAFREDFRESLYRLVGALTATGVTIVMTVEVVGGYPDVSFTTERVSFITDDIIVQRFVEIDGVLRSVLAIHKMRGSEHSHEFRTYEITAKGAVVGGPLRNYHGIVTGVPALQLRLAKPVYDGLTDREAVVLDTLVRIGSASGDLLAERVGLPTSELRQTLTRLEALGYASVTDDGERMYRALAQSGG
ncbi:MAG: ATPase domain-containing protein [Gemmatimonadaceae bacterium]|nr:ATPase domain-containing protein [Gemmatimonadaceae bacterium]